MLGARYSFLVTRNSSLSICHWVIEGFISFKSNRPTLKLSKTEYPVSSNQHPISRNKNRVPRSENRIFQLILVYVIVIFCYAYLTPDNSARISMNIKFLIVLPVLFLFACQFTVVGKPEKRESEEKTWLSELEHLKF